MDVSFTARLTNVMTLFVSHKVIKKDEDLLILRTSAIAKSSHGPDLAAIQSRARELEALFYDGATSKVLRSVPMRSEVS